MSGGADPLFDRQGWWDEGCRAFRSLRRVSAFRLSLLRRWLPRIGTSGVVVDLGCGGGLLAVPLAERGARVLGVDIAEAALREAAARAPVSFAPVRADLVAPPISEGSADLVLLADVLEHTSDPAAVVRAAVALLRPGGHLFVNTIHRTMRSRILAITLGEGLGFVPRGTHRWCMFVKPSELDAMASGAGAELVRRIGEAPRIWSTLRERAVVLRESSSLAVGYAALYRRAG